MVKRKRKQQCRGNDQEDEDQTLSAAGARHNDLETGQHTSVPRKLFMEL